MADYHMLNDGVFGVGGNDILDETANLVNAVSYSHSPSINTGGQGIMAQSMPSTPGQNPNVMMPGMVSMQQAQGGSQGGMNLYHQGAMHGYPQSEVPQKLHQYSVYGNQMQAGNMAGQYVSGGPRLHHLGDPMSAIPDQPQQSSPRTGVPGQMYQNRNMPGGHYNQQIPRNAAASQMGQGASQYPGHYGNVQQHHAMQQHAVQQVNQNADMWQNSMPHSQMTRPSMHASQSYAQHQMVPGQHAAAPLNHGSMAMQGQRPPTPNQSQYMSNQDYTASHTSNQQSSMQRPPVYNMNSTPVNQNGSMVGQMNNAPQSAMPQTLNSLSQADQAMAYPQGHYVGSQASTNRPHYNASAAVGNTVSHAPQQHVVGQQMMNVRPQVHQMGYSPVPSRVNSGQQHSGSVPPGSPARLQQYHNPPFSPNQTFSPSQPSPRPTNPEAATPPHLHYSNSQPHAQAPMSPQYRSPFPSQVTHSPQHLTPTPPIEVPPPLTPERGMQSSTPQSQGSYHSPSTTHLTSPVQGHSPGNTNAPSSLQHLEQMVLPRATSTGPSTTPTAPSASPSGQASAMSHGSGGNYYGHLGSTQQHQMHLPAVGETRPQPQSPAFSQMSQPLSHHTYLNQSHSAGHLPSPAVSSVPNSQPLQPNVSTISNSSLLSEESMPMPVETSQHSVVSFGSDNSSSIPSVSAPEPDVPRSSSIPATVGPPSTSDQINQMSCAPTITAPEPVLPPSRQYNMMGKPPYQEGPPSLGYELQQVQQELQQLYGMHQTPEIHEKVFIENKITVFFFYYFQYKN